MTTRTPLPPPAHTPARATDTRPTEPLEPAAAELTLDALPLLDHRTRTRTIAPRLALRGHYLAFREGEDTRLLRLDQNIIHIGRGGRADIRFEQHHVSRDHAILVRHGRHFRVLDNRSSNGTFVNGRRVQQADLRNGDVIVLGRVVLRYLEL